MPDDVWDYDEKILVVRQDILNAAQGRADEEKISLDLWIANVIRKAVA